MTNDAEARKEILRELVKGKEDFVAILRSLVDRAKTLFWIDDSTGKIVLTVNGTPGDNILAYLIGAYFAHELGISSKSTRTTAELATELHLGPRALSRPLGEFVKAHILSQSGNPPEYSIIYQQIEPSINRLIKVKDSPSDVKRRLRRVKQTSNSAASSKESTRQVDESGIKKLEEITKLSRNDLNHIFDFDKTDVKLLLPIATLEINESIKQYRATVLYLLAMKYAYNLPEIGSSELRTKLTDLGLDQSALTNLSTNLHAYSTQVVHKKGPKGSTKTAYRLTVPGEIEAISLAQGAKR